MSAEKQRIAFLVRRDGYAAAREWVQRTREIYARALAAESGHAALPEYRPRFIAAVEEFDAWLAHPPPRLRG